MTDEQTPSPATPTPPSADAPRAPFILQLPMSLPEEIAEFGLMEQVRLPADIFELNWETHGELIQQAVLQQFNQVAYSLATSLNAVLAMRAAAGVPLTHELYIAEQQQLLEARQAAQAAAAAEARAATEALAGS